MKNKCLRLLYTFILLIILTIPVIYNVTPVHATTSVDISSAANSDVSMYYVASGTWSYNANWNTGIALGRYDTNSKQYGMGMRFPSVNVPQGATVSNCYISLYTEGSGNSGGTAVKQVIKAQDVDNATTFSTESDFKNRFGVNGGTDATTTASVTWNDFGAWTAGNYYQSSDVSTIVQEVVNRAGWSSGNAMVFTINDWANATGDGNYRKADGYATGYAAARAPKIHIEYILANPEVSTLGASNTTATSGQMNGNVTTLGSQGTVYAYFEYGADTGYGSTTSEHTLSTTSTYNDSLTGLSAGQVVHYRAAVRWNDGSNHYVYGNDTTLIATVAGGGLDWLTGYGYRQSISLAGSAAGTVTNYQFRFDVNAGTGTSATNVLYLESHASSFPNDIRFTSSTGNTLLDYWVDPTNQTATYASIWVEVPYLALSSSTNIYIYYGSTGASSASSGINTFPYFQDFATDAVTTSVYTSDQYETQVYLTKNNIVYGMETYWNPPSRLFTYDLTTNVKTVVFNLADTYPAGRFTWWAGWYDSVANVLWLAGELAQSTYTSQTNFRGTLAKWDLNTNSVTYCWNYAASNTSEYSAVLSYNGKVYMGNKGQLFWVSSTDTTGWNYSAYTQAPYNTWGGSNYGSQSISGTVSKFAVLNGSVYALVGEFGTIYKFNGTNSWSLDETLPAEPSSGGDNGNQEWRTCSDWVWTTGDTLATVVYVDSTSNHLKLGTFGGTGTWTVLGDTGIDRTTQEGAGTDFGNKIAYGKDGRLDQTYVYLMTADAANWNTSVQTTEIYKVDMSDYSYTQLQAGADKFPSWSVQPFANGYTGEHISNSMRGAKVIDYTDTAEWAVVGGSWVNSNGTLTQTSNTSDTTYGGVYTLTNLTAEVPRKVSVAMKMNDSSGSRVGTMQILRSDATNNVNVKLTNNGASSTVAERSYVAGVDKTNHTADPGTLALSTWYRVTAVIDHSNPANGGVNFANVNKVAAFTDADMYKSWTGLGLGTYNANVSFDNLFVANFIYAEPTAVCAENEQNQETVITIPATLVTSTTATLNGNISSIAGSNATARGFNYGTTTGYGSTTTDSGSYGVGSFTYALTGLIANTIYHFRAYAVFTDGTKYGEDLTFTSVSINTPTIVTGTTSNLGTTTVTLQGSVTGMGGYTTVNVYFEYGQTTAYGQVTTQQTLTAAGAFNSPLTGLYSGTGYHYRANVVYSTSSTEINGSDATFTTNAVTGTPGTPSSLSVSSYTATSVTLVWSKGAGATNTMIRYSLTGNPASPSEGSQLYDGANATVTQNGLTTGTRVYYSAWSDNSGTYSAGYVSVSCVPTADILAVPDVLQIETVQIYSDYDTTHGQLLVYSCKILWNDTIYTTYNPSDFFYIQVLDGSVLKKQDRIKQWGYVPGSLYISGTVPLEWNKSYTFKLVGTSKFTTPPSVTYPITSANYIGNNYDNLTQWVIDRATSMQDSIYWDTLLDYTLGENVMLNSRGVQLFRTAIPGLADKCPSLFSPEIKIVVETPTQTSDGSYAKSLKDREQTSHGTVFWGVFTNIATTTGMEVEDVATLMWLLGYFFIALVIIIASSNMTLGIVCASPILLLGAQLGGVSLYYLIAVGVILAFIWIYQVFFSR